MKIWIVVKQPPHGAIEITRAFSDEQSARWHADELVKAGGAFISLQTTELEVTELSPLRPAGSADLYGVERAEE